MKNSPILSSSSGDGARRVCLLTTDALTVGTYPTAVALRPRGRWSSSLPWSSRRARTHPFYSSVFFPLIVVVVLSMANGHANSNILFLMSTLHKELLFTWCTSILGLWVAQSVSCRFSFLSGGPIYSSRTFRTTGQPRYWSAVLLWCTTYKDVYTHTSVVSEFNEVWWVASSVAA